MKTISAIIIIFALCVLSYSGYNLYRVYHVPERSDTLKIDTATVHFLQRMFAFEGMDFIYLSKLKFYKVCDTMYWFNQYGIDTTIMCSIHAAEINRPEKDYYICSTIKVWSENVGISNDGKDHIITNFNPSKRLTDSTRIHVISGQSNE